MYRKNNTLYFSFAFVFIEGIQSKKPVSDYSETGFVYSLSL